MQDPITIQQQLPCTSSEMDVYVVSRAFGKNGGPVFNSLPAGLRSILTDLGFAHFMLVFHDRSNGQMAQFDFGPRHGRDIHVSRPSWGRKAPRSVAGEVRETQLTELPDCYLHVGRTALSLEKLRAFNQDQQEPYLLHSNDCRHYINRMVTFATGQHAPKVCPAYLRHKVLHRRASRGHQRLRWNDHLLFWGHNFTDVNHWPAVHLAGQASAAMLGVVAGRRAYSMSKARHTRKLLHTAKTASQLALRRASAAPFTIHGQASLPSLRAPLLKEAARLGARAKTGMRSAAVTAASTAGSLRRNGGGSASSLAAAAAGAIRRAAAMRLIRRGQ